MLAKKLRSLTKTLDLLKKLNHYQKSNSPPQEDLFPLHCGLSPLTDPPHMLLAPLCPPCSCQLAVEPGPPPFPPPQVLEEDSSSPQCPPMLVAGVWPHGGATGVATGVWGGPTLPLLMRRVFSQISVPLLMGGRHMGSLPPSDGGSSTSQGVSWLTACKDIIEVFR